MQSSFLMAKTIYTIVPENEEITLINPTDDDEDFIFNPTKSLNIYKERI